MPLHHNDDDHPKPTQTERMLRPAAFEQPHQEPTPKTIENDAKLNADRKVMAAQKRVDKLVAANAAPAVISRAQKALDHARLDVMEAAAERNAEARAQAIAKQRDTQRTRHEQEVHYRMSEMAPVVCMVFAGLKISLHPERSTDPQIRLMAYNDLDRITLAIANASQQVAGIASRANGPLQTLPVDRPHFRAVIGDLARRSIHHGMLTIEEI